MSNLDNDQNNQYVFLSIVSHELKTPLTSIQGFTQAMQRKIDQKIADYKPNDLFEKEELQKHSDHLGLIMRQIKRLNRLVEDLLETSVIESGHLTLNWTVVDLGKLLTDVTNLMQIIYGDHEIIVSLPTSDELLVSGDEGRLEKVFSNVLSNAIKYSSPGTKILVDLTESDSHYDISIQDFGFGIPESDQANIFDLYYRGKTVDNKKYSGLGLGLYLSKQIIEQHHGSIKFVSKENKGSTFYITLPKHKS